MSSYQRCDRCERSTEQYRGLDIRSVALNLSYDDYTDLGAYCADCRKAVLDFAQTELSRP